MKRLKKGFTIVELVIVIAVIGILAGIIIPLFSNVVTKANLAADGVLVRELNNVIAMDSEVNGKHETFYDVLQTTDEYGLNVQRIDAKVSKNKILWDSKNDVFCYLKDGVIEYISFSGTESQKLQAGDYRLWTISNNVDPVYSTYLYKYTGNGVIQTDKGLDVGDEYVTSVTYAHTGPAQNVVIRTNGGTFEVNASQDTVYHYGFATEGMIKDVDNNCYYENGTVGRVIYTDGNGKIYFNSRAKVYCYMNASTDSAANLTATTKAAEAIVYTYVDSGIDQAKGYAATDKEEVVVTNGIVSISTCHNHNEDYDIIKIGDDTYLICKCCGGFSKISTDANGTTTVTSSEGINQENGNNFAAKNDDSLPIVNAVATIDYTKYYSTLAAAVSDSVNGDTITMLKNHTTAAQTFSKSITLDLNGKAVSGTGMLLTFNGTGSFTVKDSSINGSITGSQVAVKNSGTGTVVIDGGTLTATGSTNYGIYNTAAGTIIVNKGLVSGKFGIYNSATGATIRVNGGEIRGGSKSGIFCYLGRGDVIITGGTVTSTSDSGISFSTNKNYDSTGQGSLTVSGNTIISGTYGVYSGNPSTMTISGNAKVIGTGYYGIYLYNTTTTSANITINGSAQITGANKYGIYLYTTNAVNTLSVNDNSKISGLTHGIYDYNGIVTVNGGFIQSTETDKSIWSYGVYNNGTLNVNGGEIVSARVGIYESNANGIVNLDGGTISANEGIMGIGTVNIKSGTINASNIAIYDDNASNKLTVNISGGIINSDNSGVYFVSSTSSLSMTNGTINAKYYGVYSKGIATVSGGEIMVTGEYRDEGETKYIPFGIFSYGTSDNKAVLTINGGSISAPNGYALDLYHTDATITDGTLSGVNAIESWTEDSTCTISGGTFNATGGQICYAYKGFFTISGGTFTGGKTSQYEDNQYRFALNCYDSNYTGGKAGFTVMGGTFYQYNPQNDLSEGANTCFTAEGYHTEYNEETGYYTVVAD